MPYVSCSDFGSVKGPSISKAGIPLLQVDFAPYISLITRETKDSSLVGWFWFCRFGCCCCCWGFLGLGLGLVVVFLVGFLQCAGEVSTLGCLCLGPGAYNTYPHL